MTLAQLYVMTYVVIEKLHCSLYFNEQLWHDACVLTMTLQVMKLDGKLINDKLQKAMEAHAKRMKYIG